MNSEGKPVGALSFPDALGIIKSPPPFNEKDGDETKTELFCRAFITVARIGAKNGATLDIAAETVKENGFTDKLYETADAVFGWEFRSLKCDRENVVGKNKGKLFATLYYIKNRAALKRDKRRVYKTLKKYFGK